MSDRAGVEDLRADAEFLFGVAYSIAGANRSPAAKRQGVVAFREADAMNIAERLRQIALRIESAIGPGEVAARLAGWAGKPAADAVFFPKLEATSPRGRRKTKRERARQRNRTPNDSENEPAETRKEATP